MVMRHGHRKDVTLEKKETQTIKTVRISGDQLGCYYCNDVVAPGNVSISVPWFYHFQVNFLNRIFDQFLIVHQIPNQIVDSVKVSQFNLFEEK